MVGRCGCAGTCTCQFRQGRGIALSGDGTQGKPITVTDAGGISHIIGRATETALVSVVGRGSVESPYIVTMDKLAGTPRPIAATFSTPGVYAWAKPTFGTMALVELLGAGGGGGGAAGAATGAIYGAIAVVAALGGSPGQDLRLEFLLADLDDEVPITVGQGGNGGPSAVSLAIGGTAGQASCFGAASAPGGAGGGTTWQGADPAPDPRPAAAAAGAGGAGGLYRSPYYSGKPGGIPAGGAMLPGGGGASPASTSDGYPGNAPSSGVLSPSIGSGGGGGGAGSALSGGAGGAGGVGGAGAGGGGGGVGMPSGPPGGAGGAGGNGLVKIIIQ